MRRPSLRRRRSRLHRVIFSSKKPLGPYDRPLRVEPLEDRRLLAAVMVNNDLDLVNGDTSSIANLIANDGGDGIALREAILATNNDVGDEITFDTALSGQTITLGGVELEVTESLIIDATSLVHNVTIDADELSRIFNITASTGDFTLSGLTLTGGRTTGDNSTGFDTTFSGGAIRSLTSGGLTVDQSVVSGNSTEGSLANGGGIFSSGDVILTQSTIRGNSTTGSNADGGGIRSNGAVTLTQSTVSGNYTLDAFSDGGGIRSNGAVTLTQSTVSGNYTVGSNTKGVGIFSSSDIMLSYSTITDNHAMHSSSTSGGIWNDNDSIVFTSTIMAGNTAGGGNPDLDPGTGTLSVNFSLIGTGITPDAGTSGNNVSTDAPLLGSLADNGGPTETHALLAGSPAIDAGDLSAMAGVEDVPLYDQRGFVFSRVVGGRIDMGAIEAGAVSADFDEDVDADGADFLIWQRGYGIQASNATKSDGDADGDLDVDGEDLVVWQGQFGMGSTPLVEAASTASEPAMACSQQQQTATLAANPLTAELVDAAIAMDQTLRSESGARLGSQSPLIEDHFDWVSRRAKWDQPPAWQGIGEIADHSFRGQINKVNDGRFHRDADDGAVDEKLLDELFAGGELVELL